MEIKAYKKDFFKESHQVQSALIAAVNALYERINQYEQQNIPFDRIFNDDKVKYDKHGNFYTFKFQKCNIQLRILYSYLIIDGIPVIIIVDFYIKKKNNKVYIKRFENATNLDPMNVYRDSFTIAG